MKPPRPDAPGKSIQQNVSDGMSRYVHTVVIVDKRDPQHWRQRRLQVRLD